MPFSFEKRFIKACSSRQGLHQVAKKLTNTISLPNFLDETNFSFFIKASASNVGVFLFNKFDGISDGFLSIIKT